MAIWLPNFTRINGAKDGWSYRTQGSYRFVLHTTETNGLGSMPTTHSSPPQLWVDINENIYLQGIPIDKAGYALRHPENTIDTNGIFCVQVEIVARAKDTHTYSIEWYRKLALNVIKPVCDAVGIDYHIYKDFKGEGQEVLASTTSVNRMSDEEWKQFKGVCGHQHVPNNDHWDPGKLNYQQIINILDDL